jgi:hypothetical protein
VFPSTMLFAERQRLVGLGATIVYAGEHPRVRCAGRPPEGAGTSTGLAQILEKLGEPKTQKSPSHLSASPGRLLFSPLFFSVGHW